MARKNKNKVISSAFEELKATKLKLLRNEASMKSVQESDPGRPQRERKEDRDAIALQVFELRGILSQIKPHVVRIKSMAAKITDETLEVACYLLLCHAAQNFEAIFSLARDGFDSQIGVLIRSTMEALDLATLFLGESKEAPQLKAWFAGRIIPNSIAQKAGLLENGTAEERAHQIEIKSGVYFALSTYAHVSYMSLINTIDPYARDFDWAAVAGSHHVKNGTLPFASQIIVKMILTLKRLYLVSS